SVVVHDHGPHPPVSPPDDPVALRRYVAGYVQRRLVGSLGDHTVPAVGITGEDTRTLVVGDGTDVQADPGVVRLFLDTGHMPVVSSVTYDSGGGIRFLGTVTAAVALADALRAALVLPAGAEGTSDAAASVVGMSVPHAVLRHLHRLDGEGENGPGGGVRRVTRTWQARCTGRGERWQAVRAGAPCPGAE
ncbi:hypothetical protein ABZ340_34780, partial [Streptomyces sp. NPDC006134]